MSPHEKILRNDSYERAFNNANTALTISALCLKKCKVYIVDVNKFKQACDDVASVLVTYNKTEKLLHFYLWVRSKLTRLFLKASTGLGVKMNCHVDANNIDISIKSLCEEIAENKLVPLLRKLTYETKKIQPTPHSH